MESLSLQEVEKINASQGLIKVQLANLVNNIEVASTINYEEQKNIVAKYSAFQEMLKMIDEAMLEELDEEKLKLILANLETSIKAVLDSSDLNSSDEDTINLVAQIIQANLDADTDTLKSKVILASKEYKNITKMNAR